ncbi:MAG TPA: FHA domain-containing protein, partial [Phycisphaerae bacterium]|nr:FHA domain-containing protein [Phycisphaerae bacterium]
MTVTLVTFGKSGERRDFGLEKKSTVIGRKTDADLRIPLSQISRAHCEVTLNGRGAILRDLGSSNGTYVNDERIEDETVLDAGDRVRIGPIQFLVQIDGEPAKITPDMLAAPTPPDTKPVPLPTSGKRAPANAATEAGSKSTSDDIEDLDIDALDDLDLDDLSDIDFN